MVVQVVNGVLQTEEVNVLAKLRKYDCNLSRQIMYYIADAN